MSVSMNVLPLLLVPALMAQDVHNPCDNPKFKESPNTQCLDLLGDGEAQLRKGEKFEKDGDFVPAKQRFEVAYRKLKQGVMMSRRPDVTLFTEPAIRLYAMRMTDAGKRFRASLEREGSSPEEAAQKLKALGIQADEELKQRIACYESTRN